MKPVENLDELLKELVGHMVSLCYTPHGENRLRETEGILVGVNKDLIQLKLYDNFGETEKYYLNRHGCTMHSVSDYGKKKQE